MALEESYTTPQPSEVDELGVQLLRQGYLAQAEKCFRIARNAAIQIGDQPLISRTTLNWARSLEDRDTDFVLKLLNLIDHSTLPADLRPVYLNVLGSTMMSLCSFEAADKYYLASLNTSHNTRLAACVKGNRARLLFLRGVVEPSMRLNEEAVENLIEIGDPGMAGIGLMNMATHAMHNNDYDTAFRLFEQAQFHLLHTCNIKLAAFLNLNMGELELLTGNLDSAHTFFKDAKRASLSSDIPLVHVQALVFLHLLEGTSSIQALLTSLVDCSHDFAAHGLYNEAAQLPIMASCLAERSQWDPDPYIKLLKGDFAETPQYSRFIRHYQALFDALATSRRATEHGKELPQFISNSPKVAAIKHNLSKLVGTDVKILLEGETGTGKSFLARSIHSASHKRNNVPFVVVDCTNLEENLVESKLFGHLRGSFTGAFSDSPGLVELANGGTLFLDEIGELPLEIQGKLLYTIEEHKYRPIGAKSERCSEFRLISATNRDIDEMLENGSIRRDLFFRIAGYRVTLPPLRERREDVRPLAELQLKRLNEKYGRQRSLRRSAGEALVKYSWPGNIRELNSTIERGYHLCAGRRISADDLGIGIQSNSLDTTDLSWYIVRREHLLRVLSLCQGNVSRAAKILGLNRTTLIYKLKLLNIDRRDFDPKAKA